MKAMVLEKQNRELVFKNLPIPIPKKSEILVHVQTCGVCRTDLHIRDGDLKTPKLPLILGHEIVGIVEKSNSPKFSEGDSVGIPWLHFACGTCEFCKKNQENLCDNALFSGYTADGGYAEYTTCPADFAIALPANLPALEIAPMLCAGLIGYRAYKKTGDAKTLGFYGFGASAHLLTQLAVSDGKEVFAFTKQGDSETQEFAKSLGATWAGSSNEVPPELLDACILFAPAGDHIPQSLKSIKKGGRCICAGIHMSDIPSFPYQDLWGEKRIESVANLTREDGLLFFKKIESIKIRPKVKKYKLEKANQALDDLKAGKFQGAAVIEVTKE